MSEKPRILIVDSPHQAGKTVVTAELLRVLDAEFDVVILDEFSYPNPSDIIKFFQLETLAMREDWDKRNFILRGPSEFEKRQTWLESIRKRNQRKGRK